MSGDDDQWALAAIIPLDEVGVMDSLNGRLDIIICPGDGMANTENTYSYGHEQLYLAVNFLATGTGSIQERLESVANGWLGLPASFPHLLPGDLMPELKAILDELTKVHGDGGAIRATARVMSDEKGAELAERVLSLYIQLHGGI